MEQCELSIIIPIYNGARFLRDTLESVLAQTYKSYELILVDDGSTDSTPEICDEYARKDDRIKVYHQKKDGKSKAMENGYKITRPHTSIAFLDGDDIFAPDMFENMMKYKDYDVVQVCFRHINTERILKYKWKTDSPVIEFLTGEELLYRYFYPDKNSGGIGYLWGMLIKRDFYKKMEPIIKEAEKALPQNYMSNVYCVPRFLLNTQKTVLLNKIYILHRISKYTDSRTIKPNALHYESALANQMNLDYYEQMGCSFAYDKQIIGFYLVILKIWYQTVTSEADKERCEKNTTLILNYYKEYYNRLKAVKCKSLKEILEKSSIKLFGLNKTLWKLTVGKLRYGLMYKLQI